ncbi:MAG: magnesium chelatase subunit H, partial [Betaproteobacteria bacterium]|nr:magnesium chelatase subunit H [Betaproteobacteria bacterium]
MDTQVRGTRIPADPSDLRVVVVTMDTHAATAMLRARGALARLHPGITLTMHAASEWSASETALEACRDDIRRADIIVVTMLFLEDHFQPLMPLLEARRMECDAMVCMMSAPEVVKLTRIGKFDMSGPTSPAMALLKKLRGNRENAPKGGAQQMKMLRRLPQILRFIPGTAQDARAYFLTLQYWLGGSEDNMLNMVRALVNRYADGPRRGWRGKVEAAAPVEYPDVGVYHPRLKGRIGEDVSALPSSSKARGRVGILLLRSYLLAGNSGHYDGVIAALEAEGLDVVPVFAAGLDARPAIDQYFIRNGMTTVDAVVSLTGFSLVGGPAYNDAKSAEEVLARLDVPYLAAHPVEFQTLVEWGGSARGLLPVESTIMVAIPELDGATVPMVYGGRPGPSGSQCTGCHRRCSFDDSHREQDMVSCIERAATLAARIARWVELKRAERAQRRIAMVVFNFPPNAGNVGTAAYLSVFESLWNSLAALQRAGYSVDLPESVDALREAIVEGNSAHTGALANVHVRIPVDEHVRRERWLKDIEAQWGPAPGRQLTDGANLFVMGARFGHVFIGVQPGMGYEGDPMRLLFERGFAPTHAFSAFYRWIREDFKAHAVLHFGTHGALEFMPGKQTGMTGACWPDRLIGDLPNLYLYAANNPSEGAIAKRRAAATLISYLTPPVAESGLYRGLSELKTSLDRWRALEEEMAGERDGLAETILAQAVEADLFPAEAEWPTGDALVAVIRRLSGALLELEYTLIPYGLHVVGRAATPEERVDFLVSMTESGEGLVPRRAAIEVLVAGGGYYRFVEAAGLPRGEASQRLYDQLAQVDAQLAVDTEIDAILRALDGRYVAPAPGGDLLRSPEILPTGRNVCGFDPFRIPSAYALKDGARQAQRILDRYQADGNPLPESIAVVLWGTDNLKTEGAPIGQILALLGAVPRFDSYGRLAGAELVPLEQLGRPRIDVVVTLSGIFRDLMPLQIKLLAEAAHAAASADEPPELNFVRKHTLEYMARHGC